MQVMPITPAVVREQTELNLDYDELSLEDQMRLALNKRLMSWDKIRHLKPDFNARPGEYGAWCAFVVHGSGLALYYYDGSILVKFDDLNRDAFAKLSEKVQTSYRKKGWKVCSYASGRKLVFYMRD